MTFDISGIDPLAADQQRKPSTPALQLSNYVVRCEPPPDAETGKLVVVFSAQDGKGVLPFSLQTIDLHLHPEDVKNLAKWLVEIYETYEPTSSG